MLKHHHRFFNLIFQIFDLVIIAAAWMASYPLRFYEMNTLMPAVRPVPSLEPYLYTTPFIIIVWYVCFQFGGLYKSRRTQSAWPEIGAILRAHVLALLTIIAGLYFLRSELLSRGVVIVFFFLGLSSLLAERALIRSLLRRLRRRGFNLRHALIVGDNEISAAFLERLRHHPELGIFVRGVIRVNDPDGDSKIKTQLAELGAISDVGQVVQQVGIDQVVLALKNSQRSELDQILESLVDLNVDVRIIPDLQQFITLGCDVEEFEGLPLISLNQSPIIGWNSILKRASDLLYASAALLLFSPFMALIGAAIKIFTPGPIFYSQERMGLDGRVFRMFKFRTMRVDAETHSGPVWACKDDNRVTWLGALLRKTSLDELPQLINVFKGDMSCVGPRPERPALVEKFRHDIPRYMLRHKVKSGMTGWAQINGWRGDTSLEKRIEYDLYYISNWSLLFDFKIMLMTIIKGFVSKNAY